MEIRGPQTRLRSISFVRHVSAAAWTFKLWVPDSETK